MSLEPFLSDRDNSEQVPKAQGKKQKSAEALQKLDQTELFEAQLIVDQNMPMRNKPYVELYPNLAKVKEAICDIFKFLTCRGKKKLCSRKKT